jgi:hypothetical protein
MTDSVASVPTGEPDGITVLPDTRLTLHTLVIRESDDDPDSAVIGRSELAEFVELPRVGADAIRLLDHGLTVAAAEARIEVEQGVQLDVAELAAALVELGFAAAVDGRTVPDPAAGLPGSHLRRLQDRHVRWLFGRPAGAVWLSVLCAAVLTWLRQPELLITAGDFYWTDYVGLAVLVNTALFSVSLSVHELMHLAAARSYGAPARIGFATRLHHLVVQTDVTAVWAVPRRQRYRVYLAGIRWDIFVLCGNTLLVAYAGLPDGVNRLLAALSLVVVLSLFIQVQIYMRTDLYYVLMEWLRCGNLFHDGVAYVGHLLRTMLRRRTSDPTVELPGREQRAVRIYAAAMAVGSAVALAAFAGFGLPIMVEGAVRAFSGIVDGIRDSHLVRAVDSALIIAVEGTLQVIFLMTFCRRHRGWLWRGRSAGRAGLMH